MADIELDQKDLNAKIKRQGELLFRCPQPGRKRTDHFWSQNRESGH